MPSKSFWLVVLTDDWRSGGFGLYLHWPFCEAKCPYCDFNSHVRQKIDQTEWLKAYLSELRRTHQEIEGRVLNSVFFGGGTPSLMEPEIVGEILAEVSRLWPLANDIEITLEANPSSVEAGRFIGFRDAGVNRISMGIQALNDADLKRLGRLHSTNEAVAAFDIARNTFDRVSFDLIYARQDQSADDWHAELKRALSLSIDHLSLYQLTIEQGTAFGDRYARGKLSGLPDDDLGADLYDITQELCAEAGMPAYEVSNHARAGAGSRHNLVYWQYGDYIGIGPGAHGRITTAAGRFATSTPTNPERWLRSALEGYGELPRETLSAKDQAQEFLLMGLRLKKGVDPERYKRISGQELETSAIQHLVDHGMVQYENGNLVVSNQGFKVLNAVIETLLPV